MTQTIQQAAQLPEIEMDDELSNARQFVTFFVGGEVYAVEMEPVQEIIRVPEVVQVPLAPSALRGLANLRGNVLPIIDLRDLLGLAPEPVDDANRALVLNLGQPLGFVVDRVASVIMVESDHIEPVSDIQATIDTDLLTGLLKAVGGHELVMIIDFAALVQASFRELTGMQRRTLQASQLLADEGEDGEGSDELQLVSFSVAEQEYAMAIDQVQEIVQIPEHIVSVPLCAPHVRGVMTLRQRLLPLVSLREMFQLPRREADERSRILVINLDGSSVGIILDAVSEVLRVPAAQMDPMPAMLVRDPSMSELIGLCRLNEGKRLVSVVCAERLMKHQSVQRALAQHPQENTMDDELLTADEQNDDELQLVVFRLGQEEFGVPIEHVQEIVRVPDNLTEVPKAPAYVEGVMNLRGIVLPVIDQRRRFGMPSIESHDRQRIMVFVIKGLRTGFIVDSVAEVLKIARNMIESAPSLSEQQQRLFGQVANLPAQKRMIQLVDAHQLVVDGDFQPVSGVNH